MLAPLTFFRFRQQQSVVPHTKRNVTVKTCAKCGMAKPQAEFPSNGRWRRGSCRACHNRYQSEHRASNPEMYKNYSLQHTFGISVGDYQRMWSAQDGCCAICREPEKKKKLAVDHDHTTSKIRALLCENCNNGLGRYQDSPERLRAAAAYLEAHRGPATT